MAHRVEEKQARRAERLRLEEAAQLAERRQRLMRRTGYGIVGLIAATLVTFAIVRGGSGDAAATHADAAASSGAKVGAKAPDFTLTDAVSGKTVSRQSLAGHKTLLFFSEGVGCEACMVQAADLERAKALSAAGIRLVSISTDTTDQLVQAANQYGIKSPMLADTSTDMSKAYGMLGHGGMEHPTQDGHAFILLDATGKVLFHQAYQEMYVNTKTLMADIKKQT
jgi:peroxiredoxin